MVFTQLLENIQKYFTVEKDENIKKNRAPLNQLSQGLTYLQNKQNKFNTLSKKSILMEQFNTSKLNDVTQKELDILEKLKGDYNQKLSEYSQSYKTFMESYYKATEDVVTCKADCEDRHRPGTDKWSFSRTACKAGCDLKGPYISECKDNYRGSRVNGQKCGTITKGKCQSGNVLLGQNSTVTNINYADSNDVTIKDGCCECGGGIGGPPTSEINAKKVKDCNNIETALGYERGKASWAINRCHQARVNSFNTNKNLWKDYKNLTDKNENLIKLAQNIFDKISKLKSTDENINQKIKDEETHLKNQLALYENVYAEIKGYDKSKQVTIEGQVEDSLLKEQSQLLHLLIWLGLAILTLTILIQRMKK